MQIMTTKQYADYYKRITGLYISPESVAHLCRKGELEAYKEPEGKQWLIKVNPAVLPDELKAIENELIKTKATIENIGKLVLG
mgnify:FL=1